MLLLDSASFTMDGVTVFRDHADPAQFWYLPGPVTLARRATDGRAAFTFLKYKRSPGAATRGGGFLTFEVSLKLDRDVERRILERLASLSRGRPRLTVAPFDDGTVACVALNLQGAGGTTAAAAAAGSFNVVQTILGAAKPSLAGDNNAAFSLELSAEGATILEKAMKEKTTPIGVIYDLKYTGLRPAFNIKITADFKQIFTHFSSSGNVQRGFTRAGIDTAFESLVRSGAIKTEVADMTGTAENAARIQAALDTFQQQVLNTWFTPVLVPGVLATPGATAASLDQVRALGAAMRPPQAPAPARPDPNTPAPPPPNHGPSPTAGTGAADQAGGVQPTAPAADGAAADASPTAGTGQPAVTAPAPAGAAAGVSRRDGAAAPTAQGGERSAEDTVAAFQLKAVRQEEKRTATFEYNRSEAQQRTYAPQGFIGLLAQDLNRPPYFVEIDLDDPFFRTMTIEAKVPVDFAAIGLKEVHAQLDYGPPEDPENHRRKDFVFTAEDRGPKTVEFALNLRKDRKYAVTAQYHFDPQSGWDGERFSYEQPKLETDDRTLMLNPMEALSFLEVRIEPGKIDPGVIDFIDVELSYTDPAGWTRGKTVRVKPDSEVSFWKLRVSTNSPKSFSYRLVHNLKDRTKREGPKVTTRATTVLVDDPFPGSLDLIIFPLIDFSTVKAAMLDIRYDDTRNRYTRQQRVRLTPDITEANVRFSTVDPALTRFKHSLTVVRNDGRTERLPAVETDDTIVSIIV